MAQRSESIDIQDLQDTSTPFGVPLTAVYKRSFAYVTLATRLPVILTKIIDIISRNKEEIVQQHGEESAEELKQLVGFISQLINEIVTNKALKPLRILPNATNNDAQEWNRYLMKKIEVEGRKQTWFNTAWLYCECYMYRSLVQELLHMEHLNTYDPFGYQKRDAFVNSLSSIQPLCAYVMNIARSEESLSPVDAKRELIRFLKFNLWGNKCDLSLSAGSDASSSSNPLEVLESLDKDILVDNSDTIWELLRKRPTNDAVTIDIILDNAGYELFTDLCLAVLLITRKLADKVRFYVKRYPWYVSDTTEKDFHWTLEYMNNSPSKELKALAEFASEQLKKDAWTIEEEAYWTGPYDFAAMPEHDPVLYGKLSHAKLLIFKGDLNYRKLLGDINYEYTTNFLESLRGFHPTNVLSLRTVKSDICVGLLPGVAEKLSAEDETWMVTGQYGLIQSTLASACPCPDK